MEKTQTLNFEHGNIGTRDVSYLLRCVVATVEEKDSVTAAVTLCHTWRNTIGYAYKWRAPGKCFSGTGMGCDVEGREFRVGVGVLL